MSLVTRKKILLSFTLFYSLFSVIMFFGLRYNLKIKFSENKLNEVMFGESVYKEKTSDLCKFQILGDPKEVGNYVKVEIRCANGKKANSTLSLSALRLKTVEGLMKEYSRIIGFNYELFFKEGLSCQIDGKTVKEEMITNSLRATSTFSCNEQY